MRRALCGKTSCGSWITEKARRFYGRHGFICSGRKRKRKRSVRNRDDRRTAGIVTNGPLLSTPVHNPRPVVSAALLPARPSPAAAPCVRPGRTAPERGILWFRPSQAVVMNSAQVGRAKAAAGHVGCWQAQGKELAPGYRPSVTWKLFQCAAQMQPSASTVMPSNGPPTGVVDRGWC